MNLTFPAGSSDGAMQCLIVNVTPDNDVLEEEETFTVELITAETVILGNSMSTITITDNHGNWWGCG